MKAAAFLVCAFAVGCGAEIETIGEAGPAPSPAPTGTERPAVATPTPDVPPPPAREGYVSINTLEYPREPGAASDFYVSANAWFGPLRESGGISVSGCEYEENSFPRESASTEDPKSDSAGAVTIDVTLGPEKNVLKLPFDGTNRQYEGHSNGANGHANGLVRVRAAGAVVPAFDVSFEAPSPITVVSPTPGSKIGARDLAISWTSGDDDTTGLAYLTRIAPAGMRVVRCNVGKGDKQVIIPAALMTAFLAEGVDERVDLTVWMGRRMQVDAGDYRIGISHLSASFFDLARE